MLNVLADIISSGVYEDTVVMEYSQIKSKYLDENSDVLNSKHINISEQEDGDTVSLFLVIGPDSAHTYRISICKC
jgi:hypothetical protein